MGSSYAQGGRTEQAIAAFHKSLDLGGRTEILGELGAAYLAADQRTTALDYFRQYLERSQSGIDLYRVSAVFSSRGETDVAIRGFERALQLVSSDDPEAIEITAELSTLLLSVRNPQAALPHIRRTLDAMPNSMASCFNYAFALELLGSADDARQHYAKTAQVFEKSDISRYSQSFRANVLQAMGHCYDVLGNRTKAIQCLKRASKIADNITKGRIFSSIQYRDLPSNEFKAETEQLLHEITRANDNLLSGGRNE